MSLMIVFRSTFVIMLLMVFSGECCSSGILVNSTDSCCFNHYRDGNFCKECPIGYFGKNCSDACSFPYYGFECLQKCDCYPCHMIFGCISTIYTANKDIPTSETPKRSSNQKKRANNIYLLGRITLITVGTVICLILIALIVKEIIRTYMHHQISAPSDLHHVPADIYEYV